MKYFETKNIRNTKSKKIYIYKYIYIYIYIYIVSKVQGLQIIIVLKKK